MDRKVGLFSELVSKFANTESKQVKRPRAPTPPSDSSLSESLPEALSRKSSAQLVLGNVSMETLSRQRSAISKTPEAGQMTPLGRGLSLHEKPVPGYDLASKQKISTGAFGTAYRVQNASGNSFVLKEIDSYAIHKRQNDSMLSPEALKEKIAKLHNKLKVEMRTLIALDGVEGVPRYLGSAEDKLGALTIAMEHVPGICLNTKKSALDSKTVQSVMRQLLTILEQCHLKGVAHFDIKPDNLMLDPETGKLTLIDFGESRFFAPENPAIDIHFPNGTPAYQPQADDAEAFEKLGNNPIHWDTYAVGKTCERLLADTQANDFVKACLELKPISKLLKHLWLTDS